MPQTLRIAISGSYGGHNLGDEAILTSIVAELRRSLAVELTVFSRDPHDTLRRHRVDRALELGRSSRREAREVLARQDLFILGGGGILYENDADLFLREVFLAHEVGIPVMVHAVSAGPLLSDSPVRSRVRDALGRAAVITVRDGHSRQLFEEIGVEGEIVVTADPAVLLEPEPLTLEEILRAEAIDPDSTLVGFSVREPFLVREPSALAPGLTIEDYHRLVASAADFMIDRLDAEVVFFPLERRMYDVQHCHGVVGQMRRAPRATVLKGEYTPGQIVSLLQHFSFTVGMRLHFLIFSAVAGLPFVALPYATKVLGFLEELRLPAPPLGHVSAGEVIAAIDRAWDEREELRGRIASALADLRRRARLNTELALGLVSRTRDAGELEPGTVRP
jgi:polysaccharide pyruvyl transferase CsaB